MKGRFAPTPSGDLHLGNVLSYLLCWLSARSQNGSILMRVEDLDPRRTCAVYTEGIFASLSWLGLDWDEGPVYQSARSRFYGDCIDFLTGRGLTYPCFCGRAELHAPNAPHASDGTYVYPGTCRRLGVEERAAAAAKRGNPGALRLIVPDEEVTVVDKCHGPFTQNLAFDVGDFILRRSDGVFAYQLAASLDDGELGVTEVVRGRDLLESAPRQAYLLRTFGYTVPVYAHIPLLLAGDGHRLSKRDGDTSVSFLRAEGVKACEIIGALAHTVGLRPTAEKVTAAELVEDFTWAAIGTDDVTLGDDFPRRG